MTEIVDKGATIVFNEHITAFVPSRHLEKEDGSKIGLKEAADFKIIEFNKDFKRVVASHTAIFREEERKNIRKAAKKLQADNAEKTTLGDLDALANLKQQMENK